MNRRTVALLVSMTVPMTACGWGIDGNGQPALEIRPLDGFAEIDSKGDLDLRVEHGDGYSVAVNIDSNLVRYVETRVVGTTLEIDSTRHIDQTIPGPHVSVKMPALKRATLSGSGRIAVLSVHETNPVALRLSGSGQVDFDGTAPAVDVRLDGSGDVNLAGSTDHVALVLSGSGAIDAVGLPALAGSIELAGSGNVRATIDGPADVALNGSGDIDLHGDVVIHRSSHSGSGAIRVH